MMFLSTSKGNGGIISDLGYKCFLPDPFQFLHNNHLKLRRYII
jgi:hypothetical protein